MYRNSHGSGLPPPAVSPIDLFVDALHFSRDGGLHAGSPRMAVGSGDWQLASFHVETDADVHADHWEMHPAGEEAVCCVRGAFRVYLRAADPDAADIPVRLRAGQAVIVPRGTWHRLELDEPSDLMSITMRHGTRTERRATA